MKKLILSIFTLILIAGLQQAGAQCTPDQSISTGFHPDTIPGATVNVAYEAVIQFKVPKDTSINGIPATIDTAIIDDIENLPAGFSFECNRSNCTYAAEEVGCLTIKGTAHDSLNNRQFDLNIVFTLDGKIFGSDAQAPVSEGKYNLCIGNCNNVGLNDKLTASNGFSLMQNQPNPFKYNTQIKFNYPTTGNIDFKVVDLLGNVVHQETVKATSGINNINFNAGDIGTGIFLYTLNDGKSTVTRKMFVSAK